MWCNADTSYLLAIYQVMDSSHGVSHAAVHCRGARVVKLQFGVSFLYRIINLYLQVLNPSTYNLHNSTDITNLIHIMSIIITLYIYHYPCS